MGPNEFNWIRMNSSPPSIRIAAEIAPAQRLQHVQDEASRSRRRHIHRRSATRIHRQEPLRRSRRRADMQVAPAQRLHRWQQHLQDDASSGRMHCHIHRRIHRQEPLRRRQRHLRWQRWRLVFGARARGHQILPPPSAQAPRWCCTHPAGRGPSKRGHGRR